MRITIWHTDPYPTAPGVYLGCFPAMGHEVTWVVATEGARPGIVERREAGVRHIEVRHRGDSRLPRPLGVVVTRWRKLAGFLLKARLMERLARERPDVLQVRDLVTEGLLGLAAARRHRVRFAYQLDHPHFEARLSELDLGHRGRALERLWLRGWIALRRIVLRRADLVLPISPAMGEVLRDREGVDPRRMVVLPVGIARGSPERAGADRVDPRVAELRGRPTVCYLGSLALRRDLRLILSVLDAVAARVPASRFLIIGSGSEAVEGWLRGLPYRERVRLVGFVPHEEVPGLLGGATVGIFPLALDDSYGVYRTSSPLKVVEYMGAGLPVVASRVPDSEDALRQSGGGVCVENDPAAFADAVAGYLLDPERARRDGRGGQAWVEAHRTFDVLARDVEAGYRRLLATGLPAPPDSPPPRAGDVAGRSPAC
jgi:glycosyltransferase involved in cell wall biosynthesis